MFAIWRLQLGSVVLVYETSIPLKLHTTVNMPVVYATRYTDYTMFTLTSQ